MADPIPLAVTSFGTPLDPKDVKDYLVKWANLLEVGEVIDTFGIGQLGTSVADGLQQPAGKPAVADDSSILIWWEVDPNDPAPLNQDHARWDKPGQFYNVEIHIVTNLGRTFQQTWQLQVAQR